MMLRSFQTFMAHFQTHMERKLLVAVERQRHHYIAVHMEGDTQKKETPREGGSVKMPRAFDCL
jgi:hypothetical protein